MILLTGITGKTASVAARALAGKARLRGLVRNPDKAPDKVKALKDLGVEIVVGDVGDAAVLTQALAGVTDALLLLPNGEHQERLEKGFIDAAKAAGVKRVVKVSSIEADAHATATIPRLHAAVESHLKASGLAWTMIRPNFFMANFFANAATIKAAGTINMPGGAGKIGMIDSRDVGAVIAHVLSTPGHEGRSYGLSGPQSLTLAQAAEVFSEVLGRKIAYVEMAMADYTAMLGKFLPPWHARAVSELIAGIATNSLDILTPTVKELTGREPTPLRQFVADHAAVFKT